MGGCVGSVNAGTFDVTFRAAPSVPARVRSLVELRLAEAGLAGISDDLTLIASELVANAVQYAPEPEIRVRLTREPGAVVLAVWDSSDTEPTPKRALEPTAEDVAPDAEALDPDHDAGTGGRGLPIVAAMADSYGVTPTEPRGKWVWARYATATVPSARVSSPR
ncbi:Anti-sigma regulatory factor (Ser/Thr protein kinase) [Actinomadura meyerae]|uniref:Anti-sigma regulatory factor (Ser/Thr protein kinase) n=1 Tax=Actinomadura meyerae TaxID=240840 RepID=A0A239D2I3_9ACTN|nr:ATP-binding protein [Actinomadura meyerae]SNS26034.1 Anti-sigma regulatory factor (Ser/Thr protein kinase) [Actinomadura meyerae]